MTSLRQELAGIGAQLGNYIPLHTHLVQAPPSALAAMRRLQGAANVCVAASLLLIRINMTQLRLMCDVVVLSRYCSRKEALPSQFFSHYILLSMSRAAEHVQPLQRRPLPSAGVAWVGDYLPSYKVAPMLTRLLQLVDQEGPSAVAVMAAEAAASTGPPRGAAVHATAQWRALRTVELSSGAPTAAGTAAVAAAVRIDATFVSALPAHAVDETALAAAREAVLSGPSTWNFSTDAASAGVMMAQRTALSACCGHECTVEDAGATARSVTIVASLGSAAAVVSCLAVDPEVLQYRPL